MMELSKESKAAINGTSLCKALDVAMIVVHLEDTAVLWIDHRCGGSSEVSFAYADSIKLYRARVREEVQKYLKEWRRDYGPLIAYAHEDDASWNCLLLEAGFTVSRGLGGGFTVMEMH